MPDIVCFVIHQSVFMLIDSETPKPTTLSTYKYLSMHYGLPPVPRLQELLGQTFANEQKHRLYWLENHISEPWDPSTFTTENSLQDSRLQRYLCVEVMKARALLFPSVTEEDRIAAYREFISAAQHADRRDRIRSLRM
jgi:hypothetical protein